MMKYFNTFLLLLTAFSCSPKKSEYENVIRQIQQKYVPDRRDDIFDIQAIESGEKLILKGSTTVAEARDELLQSFPQAIDSVIVLPDPALEDEIYAVANVSVADVRTDNSYAAEMATQVLLGMPVELLQQNKWWRIRTPEGYLGWTTASSFTRTSQSALNEWLGSEKIIFTDLYGFSYEKPDNQSQTVSDLVFGNLLKYLGEQGEFYRAAYPGGDTAYVRKSEAKPFREWFAETELTEESILEKALLLKGIPYTWGGTSTKMMDCSGFTKTVFLMNGIVLLRDASQQVNTGISVDISGGYENLRKGDLMFFGKKGENGQKDRIRHVAIYIGDNQFIHESGFARIASLDPTKDNYDEVNAREFVQARRIIGAVGTEGITTLDKILTNK